MPPSPAPPSPASGQDASTLGLEAQRILSRIVRSRAAWLACRGRYGEAESMLEGLPRSAEALDLLARIRSQQGKLGEAHLLWQEALQLEPGNASISAGLAEARRRLGTSGLGALGIPDLKWLAILSLLACFAFLMARKPGLNQVPIMSPQIPASPAVRSPNLGIDIEVSAPLVALKRQGGEVVLEFTESIFDGSARLSRAGAASLTLAGRQMEARGAGLAILVEGRSDATPIPEGKAFRSNEELAMARAQAVHAHLLRTTRLPSGAFTLQARVVAPGQPVPSARTAVLRISRAEGPKAVEPGP